MCCNRIWLGVGGQDTSRHFCGAWRGEEELRAGLQVQEDRKRRQ